MLKIKDNVDLKELEKFGFVYYDYGDNHSYYMYPNPANYKIYIFIDDRNIYINDNNFYDNDLTVLYDLIKADLVEKISN